MGEEWPESHLLLFWMKCERDKYARKTLKKKAARFDEVRIYAADYLNRGGELPTSIVAALGLDRESETR